MPKRTCWTAILIWHLKSNFAVSKHLVWLDFWWYKGRTVFFLEGVSKLFLSNNLFLYTSANINFFRSFLTTLSHKKGSLFVAVNHYLISHFNAGYQRIIGKREIYKADRNPPITVRERYFLSLLKSVFSFPRKNTRLFLFRLTEHRKTYSVKMMHCQQPYPIYGKLVNLR